MRAIRDPEDLACVHREVLHDVVDRAHPRHVDALSRDARFDRRRVECRQHGV